MRSALGECKFRCLLQMRCRASGARARHVLCAMRVRWCVGARAPALTWILCMCAEVQPHVIYTYMCFSRSRVLLLNQGIITLE